MKTTIRWKTAQYFEVKWWQNYLKNKDLEGYLDWKRNYWLNFLQKINKTVQLDKNQNILDVGCGPAGIFIVLQDYNITAVDPLLDSYHESLKHFKREYYPATKFKTVALEEFKEQEKYDLLFCINAINHVSDLKKAFENLVACCKTQGKLVVSIDAHNHGFIKTLFKLQPGDILHPHQYDLAEYTKMLTDLNCEVVQTELIKKEFLFNHYVLVAIKK